ncbi:MAG: hypothetical protein LBU86_07035, partial [Oscillospiraceae bacterium]|nr:hypothetical protein [Oscillospiraceae bacterium]
MASVGSVGFYAQLSSKNKGVGGLASGLNTDELVESLTMATRTKLAKQNQTKTQLGWKTTAYRSVATTLRGFQSSYITSAAGSSSLKMQAFFNTYEGTASSDKISVSAGTSSAPGTFSVDAIKQLATNQTFVSDKFTSELVGESVDLSAGDFANKTLQLQMGSTVKTIKLDTLQQYKGNAAAFNTELQRLVNSAFGTKDSAGNNPYITASVTANAGKYNVSFSGGTSTVSVRNSADVLGLKSGMSNRINASDTVADIFGSHGLDVSGGDYKVSINDVVISFGSDESMNAVMNKINNSTAGVRVAFDPASEQFTFTSKVMGAGNNIVMRDLEGNFLNTVMGAEGGNSFASVMSYSDASQTGLLDLDSLSSVSLNDLSKHKFRMTAGGKSVTLSLDVSADIEELNKTGSSLTMPQSIVDSLNAQIEANFGKNSGLAFEIDAGNNLSFVSSKNDQEIYFSKSDSSTTVDAFTELGLNANKNTAFTMGYTGEVKGASIGDLTDLLENSMLDETYTMKMTVGGVTKDITVKVKQAELDKVAEASGDSSAAGYAAKLEENQRLYLAELLNVAKRSAFGSDANAAKVKFSV